MAARKRPEGFDLREAIRAPSFTPAVGDAPALARLVGGDDEAAAKDATQALLRLGERAVAPVVAAIEDVDVASAVRLVRFLGRLPGDVVRARLLAFLASREARIRRAATGALARVGGEGVEEALLALLPGEDGAETRAIASALGKIGGERSADALAAIDPGDDAELAKIVERAKLMRRRDAARATHGTIRAEASPREPARIELTCRNGLEALLLDELLEVRSVTKPAIVGPGRVAAMLRGSLASLDECRLALDVAFVLPDVPLDDEVRSVVAMLDGPVARSLLATFTDGTPRIRIDFPGAGPRRSLTWSIASALAERGLVNDPREALWEARLAFDRDGVLRGKLVPRGRVDARFDYRLGDVPAASHPTIAAAIARLAGVRDDDVVWDPFVGSGSELVERAKLGPYREAYGTDLDPNALAIARANLDAAHVRAVLEIGDATRFVPRIPPTLVVSNPPMGRRVHRGDVGPLLASWCAHLARVLAHDARLAFVSPLPRTTFDALTHHGFALERSLVVDMGGFDARLERWSRRARGGLTTRSGLPEG